MTSKYDDVIKAAAEANGLDPVLFRKQLVQESSLNPSAVSKAGALGIGQIMPKYWTGKHGLNTQEDFMDPVKSINASAAIMGNHVKTFGSWNAALVAYNAGPGKGNSNIQALTEGRLQDLPKETQGYLQVLRNDGGVAQTPSGKFKPGTTGTLFEPGEVSAVAGRFPTERGTLDTTGGLFRETPNQSLSGALIDAVKHNPIATTARFDNPMAYIQGTYGYTFDDADLNAIRGADIGAAGARFVMSNAQKKEDVEALIGIAKENRASASTKRSLVGDLVYGVGEAIGDPITYGSLVIPGGLYGRAAGMFSGSAARVLAGGAAVAAEGSLTNAASEVLREGSTGTDADIGMALAAGAVFSVGMTAAGHGVASVARGMNRVESSETARVLREQGNDVPEPTLVNAEALDRAVPGWRDVKPSGDPLGVLLETPTGDTIHPASGTQFTSHNPINPRYNPPDPNLMGRATMEVGDLVARSEVPEHRQMAAMLLRTSRGYSDGTSGHMGITAQDVDATIRGDIADFQKTYDSLRERAFSDPAYQNVGTKTEQRRLFNERVIRAAEQGEDGIKTLIPGAEQEAARLRLDWYHKLGLMQQEPGARWGIPSPSLLSVAKVDDPNVGPARPALKGGMRENYAAPVIYNEIKVGDMVNRLGLEESQQLVARSFMKGYMEKAEVKARVDEYLTSIGSKDTPEEYAMRVAYGIVSQDKDLLDVGRLQLLMETKDFSTKNTPDFRKMRSPFEYHHEIDMPDGTKFSVNDLRSWDADLIDASYANKVKGDVSVAVGTGMTPQEFSNFLAETKARAAADGNLKKEFGAFEKIAGNLYGVGIRNGGERMNSMINFLQDLAFMKSSAYMALLNYSEIAAGVMRNGLGFTFRAVPGIGNFMQDLQLGKKTAGALRAAQNLVWGSALERAILPTYKEAIDQSRRRLYADSGVNTMNTFLGGLQGATSALAGRWWTARALNHTTEKIVEAARGEFFADVTALAHGVRKSSFGNEKTFRAASLTKDQMDGVLDLLRNATKFDAQGNLEITNPSALTRGAAAADLRRYGQFWSERVIQQNTLGSTFRWSHLPLIRPLTQFMSFVGRSFNAKLIRGNSDIMRNGDVGEAISLYMLSPVLAGSMYAATAYLQSMKYTNESDRQQFLKERLGTKDDIGPLVAGAVKRMAVLSMPSWAYDGIGQSGYAQKFAPEVFQYAGFGKTSVEAKLKRDARDNSGVVGGLLGGLIEQSPAVKIADSVAGLATGGIDYMTSSGFTERQKAQEALMRSLGGLILNDPVSQKAFFEFKDASGVK